MRGPAPAFCTPYVASGRLLKSPEPFFLGNKPELSDSLSRSTWNRAWLLASTQCVSGVALPLNAKYDRVRCGQPVIPALQEAETGGLLGHLRDLALQ